MTWTLRACTAGDLATVTELFALHDLVEFGWIEMEPSDVEEIFDTEGDAWLAHEGVRPVGFAHLRSNGECDTVTDPAYQAPLRRALVELVVTTARHKGMSHLEHWAGAGEHLTAPALRPFGFEHAVTTWRMERHLDTELPEAAWPGEIELSPFVRERDSGAAWRTVQDAFRGTGFSDERTHEEWSRKFLDAGYDVLCARRGGELVGCAVHGLRSSKGHVAQLAVPSAERGKGVGRALLREAFRRDAERGLPTALTVDGRNATALGLYRGLGMTLDREYRRWDLHL
jgi:GNAT superfamily N-acetyltransferase